MLYITDLDGTLLNAEARLDVESVRLLNKAIADGTLFTVATARTPATVVPIFRDVDMQLPAIVMTGAALWDFKSQTYSDVCRIDAEAVRAITRAFAEAGVTPFVYTIDSKNQSMLDVFFDGQPSSAADRSFYEARKHLTLKKFHLDSALPCQAYGDVLLFFASGLSDVLVPLGKAIANATGCSVSLYDDIYNPGTALIEVFAPGVSKAAAILRLRERVGAERITFFGDNLNDLPAFEVSDVKVAVANAAEPTLAAADTVIGPNTEASVARYIQRR